MKVLIVERDLILLETMREICSGEDYNPAITRNCEEASELLSQGYVPDIILCDETLAGLKEFRLSSKEIPFILMRATRKNLNEPALLELMKPFSIEDMLELFRKVRLSSQTRT